MRRQWIGFTKLADSFGIYETTTYRHANAYGAEGPKTISYEIFEDLSGVPDFVVVPVGGGGTLSGIWQGFVDLKRNGLTSKLPRLIGVLPYGYKLLDLGLREGARTESDLKRLANFDLPASGQVKLAMSFRPMEQTPSRLFAIPKGSFCTHRIVRLSMPSAG